MSVMLTSLWHYRHFVISSIQNEFRLRFARSKLGLLWMFVSPLAQVAIYVIILSNVLSAKLSGIENRYSYAIYLMAGQLAWSLFSEIITRSTNLFIDRSDLIKKISFPRITLPGILVGSSILSYLILLVIMICIYALLGHFLNWATLYVIPLTITVVAFGIGAGLILGILNVFLRDIGQGVPILLQIWFWFTPIVYPENIIPESYRQILLLNPMYIIIKGYHNVLVYGVSPPLMELAVVMLAAFTLMVLSLLLFRRVSPEMVDVL